MESGEGADADDADADDADDMDGDGDGVRVKWRNLQMAKKRSLGIRSAMGR